MRVVVFASSPYSETGCAVAARLSQAGYVPAGALTLPSWDRTTLLRKVGQWGFRDSYRYAAAKLGPGKPGRDEIRNSYLGKSLRHENGAFRSLNDVARQFKFPVVSCADQNSSRAVAQLRQWSADLAIFTGGNILREETLKIFRLGVLNSHLALLPEIRGMSSPEWSLLAAVPLGITIHFMDRGIDTGPILLRREFTVPPECNSLIDLRNRMIAEGIELIVQSVSALDRGAISPVPQDSQQASRETDNQFFVMHERLKIVAAANLGKIASSQSLNANRQSGLPRV
jgi:folate-dependent phosphoribosylglycinamide formyltransferase PurN